MDPMAMLAQAAAQAVLQAMTTDGWMMVRARLARVFGRGEEGQEQRMAAELDASREALRSGQAEQGVVAGRWQGRLEALLERHPEVVPELEGLIRDVAAAQRSMTWQMATHGPHSPMYHHYNIVDIGTNPSSPAPPAASTGNAYSTAAITLGIISFVFCPIVLGPLGLILAAIGKSKGESRAVVGLVISGLGLVIGMILGIIVWDLLASDST